MESYWFLAASSAIVYYISIIVTGFGDPHIITVDGLSYTFNGLGEFLLIDAQSQNERDNFVMQGRTVQTLNSDGKVP